jgi:hypothetical protein
MLTEHQLQFFRTYGYLSLPQALSGDIAWIQDEFEAAWRSLSSIAHDGSKRTRFPSSFITASRKLTSLIDHPAVCDTLDALLGQGWSSYGGDGNLYAGESHWHSDVPDKCWEAKTTTVHIKVAFYLDRLTAETGALRVIPGSHHFGDRYARLIDERLPSWGEGISKGDHGRAQPSVALTNDPGDLILFDHRLKHASFGGGPRRRMFTLNTFAPCATPGECEAARTIMRHYRDHLKVNWTAGPGWLDWIATLSEKGKSHHEQVVRFSHEIMGELATARS